MENGWIHTNQRNANIFLEWMFTAAVTTNVPDANEAEKVLLQQAPPRIPPQNDTIHSSAVSNFACSNLILALSILLDSFRSFTALVV